MESMEEDKRAAKLALARKKLKDHQEKKLVSIQKVDSVEAVMPHDIAPQNVNNNIESEFIENVPDSSSSPDKPKMDLNSDMDLNVTEILISNKRNLENKVTELELKLTQLQTAYSLEANSHNATKQQLINIQSELKHLNDEYSFAMENIKQLERDIKELNSEKSAMTDVNNNITEQLELTKSILTAKETENASIRSHLQHLQNEFDVTKLQLQQLNNGVNPCPTISGERLNSEKNEVLLQKINTLEQQLNVSQKERDQINCHYENYVGELNAQLKSVLLQNDELSKKVKSLCARENCLIDQISEMEIRIQSLQVKDNAIEHLITNQESVSSLDVGDLQEKYTKTQEELKDVSKKYLELQEIYAISESKVKELQESMKSNCTHENISITKLTADIASDKVAAQRATEQNKKLKNSMQELEEAFVKMSQDKLELTEKLTAEKFLNRELTIKLAEIEEKSKDMHTKLMAKDEEMIRLQMTYRDLEKDLNEISAQSTKKYEEIEYSEKENTGKSNALVEVTNETDACLHESDSELVREHLKTFGNENLSIPQEDAMLKLQERFMKIMGEVADLSDEKHRLEHIILQLQNETDTICEYVALYQQQRSLLKKRDEERNAQVKLFQVECDRLKSQLEELSKILLKFAEDSELASYFKVESRQKDMDKVRSLLINLKSNTLVDPKNNLELSNVYPCNCCSGNLIDV